MNTRFFVRLGAVGAAASVSMLAAGPSLAAAPVAQASASALSIGLAGPSQSLTGTYTASTDGTNETTSGNKSPALTVAGPLQLLGLGVTAQDATTSVNNGDGNSAACAGLAGRGAALVAVGDAGSCLTPGSVLNLSPGSVDLTGLDLTNLLSTGSGNAQLTSLLESILGQPIVQQLDQQLLDPLLSALSSTLQTALGQLQLGLKIGLGAVTASCKAAPGTASGSASVVDAGVTLTLPTLGDVQLVKLPVNPAPNTHVLTNLDQVITAVENALQTEVNTLLAGPLSQLGAVLKQVPLQTILDAVNDNLIKVIEPQLAPLEQNLLDITLNKQTSNGPGQINVTALDLQVLPVAQKFLGNSLVSAQIGQVSCGPNSRLAVAPLAKPNAAQVKAQLKHKKVPHKVTSGLVTKPTASDEHRTAAYSALAGLGAIATAAGVIGLRRRTIKG